MTTNYNVEGSRKDLLGALSTIMSQAAVHRAKENNQKKGETTLLRLREPRVGRGEHLEEIPDYYSKPRGENSEDYDDGEGPIPSFIQTSIEGAAARSSEDFRETCKTIGTEIQTREECKQVVELECKPAVRFRTEIKNRCKTLVDRDCKVVFKDEPDKKCVAIEEEHCHIAYKEVEANHYKDECHTDIQNICEEQIRIPVEVPYPVRVPYPVKPALPKAAPYPTRTPAYHQYQQNPTKASKSPKNYNPYPTKARNTRNEHQFYLLIPETQDAKSELDRYPKSLLGERDGEATEEPVYAYNPTPTPQNSPVSDFIRKLDRTPTRKRRRRDVATKDFPSLLSKTSLKSRTQVKELPARPGCRSIATKTCHRVPVTVVHKVPYENCTMVPSVKCHLELKKVGHLDCVPVVDEECEDFVTEVPYQGEEECEDVIYDECIEVRLSEHQKNQISIQPFPDRGGGADCGMH